MSLPAQSMNITVEEYLQSEPFAPFRREFVDGRVFAMTGATDAHNGICGNLHAILHANLKGSGCRVYVNDMKVRIEELNCFYYPDLVVTCEPYDPHSVFKTSPVIIMEVLSPSTKRIDLREKLIGYRKLDSLMEYLTISQDRREIEIHRRITGDKWESTTINPPEDVILQSFPNTRLKIDLDSIYDDTEIGEA